MGKLNHFIRTIYKRLSFWDKLLLATFFLLGATFVVFFRREIRHVTTTFKVTDKDVLYAITNPQEEFANAFTVGDTERNEFGQVISEIMSVNAYRVNPGNQVVYLEIRLKTVYNFRKNQYSMKGKPVIFGQSFVFNFSNVSFQAIVTTPPGFKQVIGENKLLVKARLRDESREFSDTYGVPDYVAGAVKAGDTMKDSAGKVLAQVKDVQVKPARRTVVVSTGRSVVIEDLDLKDVFFTIELTVKEVAGKKYMLDFIPVLVNQRIPLNLENISLWPVITEVLNEQ